MNVKIEHLIVKVRNSSLSVLSVKNSLALIIFKDRLKTADKNIVQLVCTAFAIHRIICNNAVYIFLKL